MNKKQKKEINGRLLMAYDKYAPDISRHIYFRVGDQKIAEDLLQETFLKTIEYVKSGKEKPKRYKNFLYTVANNLITDYYRRKYKRPILLEDFKDMETLVNLKILSVPADQYSLVEKRMKSEAVKQAISELDEMYKKIVFYYFFKGLKAKEVSQITGKSVVFVGSAVRNIKKTLKRKMQEKM